ncbi:hypothetical protein BLX87_05420, partial [Bacillus sp. VT-16-64]
MSENYITFEELKQRLTPGQRLAAELIVANDFAPKGEKKTLDQIAEEVGITDRQLYNWRQNPDFTRYMAAISDNKLDNYRSLADSQLIKQSSPHLCVKVFDLCIMLNLCIHQSTA